MSAALASFAIAGPARAQEFATPAPGPLLAAGSGIEQGLLVQRAVLSFGALHVRHPLGITTSALIVSSGVSAFRFDAGVARTGDAELGWSSAGLAAGIATAHAGAAVRSVARRDDGAAPGDPAAGVEAGVGGWLGSPRWRVWVSAPQVWRSGLGPPLVRGLTLGAGSETDGITAALEREAPRSGFAEEAAYRATLGLTAGPITAWAEARDRPWRGGIGLAAQIGPVQLEAQVDAHPVLEPTTRVALGVAFGGREP